MSGRSRSSEIEDGEVSTTNLNNLYNTHRPALCLSLSDLLTLPGWGPSSGPFKEVFDPLNLAAGATVTDVRRWRESEITHGRVSMLAALGFVVGEQLQDYQLFYNFDGGIEGPAIKQFSQVSQGFWEPLLIAIGLAESYRVSLGEQAKS